MPKGEKRVSKAGNTYYYSAEAGKAYRDRLMAAARAGGYEPKKRVGAGLTQKRVSSKGTIYYYQPWASLTAEQKASRLAAARNSARTIREQAAAYRREHSQT